MKKGSAILPEMFKSTAPRSPPPYQKLSEYRSPLLDEAMNRYRSELKDGGDFILDGEGVEGLLNQARALEPRLSRRTDSSSASLTRIEPMLSHMNNFAAILAVCFGADAKVAALVWGSIKVILRLASPTQDILSDVLDMLEEISWSLPRFTTYEQTLPMDESFESSLVAAYTEMTCFCARTINFFRSHPHSNFISLLINIVKDPLLRKGWPQLSDDFQRTITRLKRLSQIVETEAEAARMRLEGERHTEVLSVMKAFGDKPKKDVLPCYYLPPSIGEKLIGRENELSQVADALDPKEGNPQRKSLAVCGMGGVGKTTIARRYANIARDRYDAVFWISADNMTKMTQNFLEVAQKLELVPGNRKTEDAVAAMAKVKSWLADTSEFPNPLWTTSQTNTDAGCRWLVVFDNADDLEILTCAWPPGISGSILLTTRDFTAGFSPAATGLTIQPFDDGVACAAFLELLGQSSPTQPNIDLAKKITHDLGGLPLALRQISGFILQQRLALKDFLPLYERNAARIHTKKAGLSDYQHTLSTVWDLALSSLTGHASSLQKLLAFFDPDQIAEEILTADGPSKVGGDEFDFLTDEMDFLDAKEVLLRAALVDRSEGNANLSVHRLVQTTVIRGLSTTDRERYFNQAINLLVTIFPCAWKDGTGYKYTFTSWDKCEMCLPHVHFLVAQAAKYKIRASDRAIFAELLMRCSWYLYECERCHQALPLITVALREITDQLSLAYTIATDIHGLLTLDTNHPREAAPYFLSCLKTQEATLPPNSPFIATSYSHVSLAYTELREWEKAAEYQQKAMDIRIAINSPVIGNSYSNMSSILLGMGKPDEAEEMLMRCPSLKDMTDESFLRTDNPRFSRYAYLTLLHLKLYDMVLLSRIRVHQSRYDDALRLRSKALAFRQKTYGDKYKTCDSLYQIADLLHRRGDSASAVNLIEKSIAFLENLTEPEGYQARAYFKLWQIYSGLGKDLETEKLYKGRAIELLSKCRGEPGGGPGEDLEEEAFNSLVPWMLW
ncbi:hypothetical protein FGG08_001142 [Glutinoglossum americanum]|uniref:NB-ARC domain-containing protein n=1 Tax=Glutinoglossum americanum TaxID=1670608 RepID=A0A9P8IBX4_9PEZI|nr:hypothetical protein FGG08_001142 [Glutinoglossum americanum]